MKKIITITFILFALAGAAQALESWQELLDKAPSPGDSGWAVKEQDFKDTLVDTLAETHDPDGTHQSPIAGAQWVQVAGPVTWLSSSSFKLPQTALFEEGRKVFVNQAVDVIGVVDSASDAAGETTVTLKSIVLYSNNASGSSVTSPITSVSVSRITPRSAPEVSGLRITTAENNIALNAYRVAVNGSFASPYNMTDGVGDNFGSESGVDTSASNSEVYDAAGDYYFGGSNVNYLYDTATPSNELNWDISVNGTQQEAGQCLSISPASGTISSVKFWLGKLNAPTGSMYARIYDVTGTPGVDAKPTGTALGVSEAFDISTLNEINNYQWAEFTFATPVAVSGGEVAISVSYTGGSPTIRGHVGGHAASAAHAGNAFHSTTAGSAASATADVGVDVFFDFNVMSSGGDMMLISNATEASAEPDDARIVAFVEPVEAITLNTDFKCFTSKDDGSTYDQITLADEGEYESGKNIYAGSITLSTSGDQTMRVKCSTHNSKDIRIHDWTHLWR